MTYWFFNQFLLMLLNHKFELNSSSILVNHVTMYLSFLHDFCWQQAATAFLIYFGGKLGMISIRSMDLKTSKRLLPLSLFYNANVAFALASLKGINVPMYIALKRLTPLTVLLAGFFYGKARPSPKVFRACSLDLSDQLSTRNSACLWFSPFWLLQYKTCKIHVTRWLGLCPHN